MAQKAFSVSASDRVLCMGMSVSFTMDEETSVPPEESRVILNGDTSASLTRETMDELTSGETLALFTGEGG